ncbi:hypothetical protein PLESTM_000578800 [Pleodorina starrii]|nr:hypothetical protein PLESTM_000578800 [Pleodorina starrii]
MRQGFEQQLDDGVVDEDVVRDWRRLIRVFDARTNRPLPFHTYYDAGDAQELEAAVAADNTMVVHLEFGSSIKTDPAVPRTCRLCLPRLCLVSFAKRAVGRQLCPGLYPSFIRLSRPDTGEVLEDVGSATGGNGARTGEAGLAGTKRTLASYDIGDQSVLRLDIVEGSIFEAIDYSDLANTDAVGPRQAGPAAGPAAAAATTAAAAAAAAPAVTADAAAAAAQGNSPAAREVQMDARRAPAAAGGNVRPPQQALRPHKVQSRREWTREETIALLEGIIKFKGGKWKQILEHPDFADTLSGRNGVNLKDRLVTLEKAAERNFQNMKHKATEDTELINLTREALRVLRKL